MWHIHKWGKWERKTYQVSYRSDWLYGLGSLTDESKSHDKLYQVRECSSCGYQESVAL